MMATSSVGSISQVVPDARGRYGPYGGRYVPETLMAPLEELERAYAEASADPSFQARLSKLLHDFAGRPRRSSSPRVSRNNSAARAFISSAKICCTPVRTKSTIAWARVCWPCAWARSA
jgi:tryptophan synthase beta chain